MNNVYKNAKAIINKSTNGLEANNKLVTLIYNNNLTPNQSRGVKRYAQQIAFNIGKASKPVTPYIGGFRNE